MQCCYGGGVGSARRPERQSVHRQILNQTRLANQQVSGPSLIGTSGTARQTSCSRCRSGNSIRRRSGYRSLLRGAGRLSAQRAHDRRCCVVQQPPPAGGLRGRPPARSRAAGRRGFQVDFGLCCFVLRGDVARRLRRSRGLLRPKPWWPVAARAAVWLPPRDHSVIIKIAALTPTAILRFGPRPCERACPSERAVQRCAAVGRRSAPGMQLCACVAGAAAGRRGGVSGPWCAGGQVRRAWGVPSSRTSQSRRHPVGMPLLNAPAWTSILRMGR